MGTPRRHIEELTAARRGRPDQTGHVVVSPTALDALVGWLAAHRPGVPALVIADAHTRAAAGDAVAQRLGAAQRDVRVVCLAPRPGDDHLVCEDGVIDEVARLLHDAPDANPIAVGAGTINDVVKMAATHVDRPYQVVPTAASMNGYTSVIAAVLSRGVKRTLPARQPEALFADVGVLCRAPAFLTRAGFGDLLSKPYSNADWVLSHLVRGVAFDPAPGALVDDAFGPLLAAAEAIGAGEPVAITLLAETLIVSGFAMAIAGTSAPASGGEHLVSHYWDMEQHCQDAPLLGLHGTQVGVGTLASAHLFERLVALEADAFDPEAARRRRPDPAWLDALAADHPRLTPAVVEEVRAQIAAKSLHGDALAAEIAEVRDRWPAIRDRLRAELVPADRIAAALRAAGCADRPSALGVGRDHAVRTLRVCRHIRGRYVALDLIDDLGLLAPWSAAVVDALEAP